MTQTSFFDEIGRLMNDAAGAAQGVMHDYCRSRQALPEK
jgi:hypothetical protein